MLEIDTFGDWRLPGRDPVAYTQTQSWRKAAVRAAQFLTCDESRVLLNHWRGLGQLSHPPGRRHLDPAQLGAARTHVWLMDFAPEERQLYYREIGAEAASRYSENLIGKYLQEIVEPEAYPRVASYFLACVEMPAISIVSGRLFHEWPRPWFGERLLLPLFDEQGHAEGLVGIVNCRKTSLDKAEAERTTERHIRIIPLEGGEIIEKIN